MAPAADTEGRRVAILIGQNRFPKAEHLTDLAFAEADMHAIAERLTAAPGKAYDQIVKIPTGPSHEALAQMEDVASTLSHEDTLLIYYSGHGLLDKSRRLNLAFENTMESRLTSTSLKVGQVLDLFRSGRAKSRVLVLDCCYAGGVGAEFDRSSLPQQIETDVTGTGTVVLTSATKAQVARENPDYGHGIFTKHMLDGLAGAADLNGDGIITAQELYEYTHARVTSESGQRPQRFNHELEGQIVLHQTGLTPWKDKAYAIGATLKRLNDDHLLSDRLFLETFALAKKQPSTMTQQERKRFALLENLDATDFRPGSFQNAWEALPPEPQAAPQPAPKPKPPAPEKRPQDPPPKPARLMGDGETGATVDTSAPETQTTGQDSSADLGLTPQKLVSGIQGLLNDPVTARLKRGAEAMANKPDTKAETPAAPSELKATLIFIGFVLGSLMIIGNAMTTFIAAEDLGAVMIIIAGVGGVYSFTKHVGEAKWRKIGYRIYSGLIGLSGLGFLTNVGY